MAAERCARWWIQAWDGIQKITLGNEGLSLEQYIPFYLAVSPAPFIDSHILIGIFIAGLSGAVMKRDALEQALLP